MADQWAGESRVFLIQRLHQLLILAHFQIGYERTLILSHLKLQISLTLNPRFKENGYLDHCTIYYGEKAYDVPPQVAKDQKPPKGPTPLSTDYDTKLLMPSSKKEHMPLVWTISLLTGSASDDLCL